MKDGRQRTSIRGPEACIPITQRVTRTSPTSRALGPGEDLQHRAAVQRWHHRDGYDRSCWWKTPTSGTASPATRPFRRGGYNVCAATSDWAVFRNIFGLPRYGNPVSRRTTRSDRKHQLHRSIDGQRLSRTNSGINADDVEASIDVEWASAAAPNAYHRERSLR